MARELAEAGCRVLVIDQREHIAGNCHTERDEGTGIMVHRYGPHIFNTNSERAWSYAQKFARMIPYTNRVKASVAKGIYSLPINLHTINQFFGTRLNPAEAEQFIRERARSDIKAPNNLEEQALSMIGDELYGQFFYGYTKKQWGCEPTELPASIMKRLPLRFSYNDNYYDSRYQGIPEDGYTWMISRILDHERITIQLNTCWEAGMASSYAHVVFTGALDEYFNKAHGSLGYRTVYWTREEANGDLQGNAVINYCEEADPHTRTHEHKHFTPWEEHNQTLVFTEFSKETEAADIPYYPKRLDADMAKLRRYEQLAQNEQHTTFLGRLGTYRYLNMDAIILQALEASPALIASIKKKVPC